MAAHKRLAPASHEKTLLTAATLAANGYHAPELRMLAETDLSPNAAPAWYLLRGAAQAFSRVGANHEQHAPLRIFLTHAVRLATEAGLPEKDWKPTYTGGARPHIEKDA